MRPAVFLDRDGTINEEIGYIRDPSQYRLLPGAARAIASLNARCIPAVLVTNQSGPARGFYGEETVRAVLAEMHRQLAVEGARLDGAYYCPHLPAGAVPAYAVDCDCRKPKIGMLLRAARELDLDLAGSYVVGDKSCDIELADRAGCRSVLVLTGYGREIWPRLDVWRGLTPDRVAGDLAEAVAWIVEQLAGERGQELGG